MRRIDEDEDDLEGDCRLLGEAVPLTLSDPFAGRDDDVGGGGGVGGGDDGWELLPMLIPTSSCLRTMSFA